jgi:hypothetical protein
MAWTKQGSITGVAMSWKKESGLNIVDRLLQGIMLARVALWQSFYGGNKAGDWRSAPEEHGDKNRVEVRLPMNANAMGSALDS